MELSSRSEIHYDNWNDPNELVDRFQLILSRQTAGHFCQVYEMVTIIEELRKTGYIQ